MIDIIWYCSWERIGETRTPCVPRKGELVTLNEMYFSVESIIWVFNQGINNSHVEIHVRKV